jgi:hypothetical protein
MGNSRNGNPLQYNNNPQYPGTMNQISVGRQNGLTALKHFDSGSIERSQGSIQGNSMRPQTNTQARKMRQSVALKQGGNMPYQTAGKKMNQRTFSQKDAKQMASSDVLNQSGIAIQAMNQR